MEALSVFSDPAFQPFAIAGAIVAAIALLELLSLVLGFGLFDPLDDLLPDIDAGDKPGLLGWLGFGEVPFMVVLVVILALFSVIGTLIQSTAIGITDHALPTGVAALVAFAATLPAAGHCARGLAKIIPSVESSGVEPDDLVGCTGEIVQGVASSERVAEARVSDTRAHSHWLQVRAEQGEELQPGDPVRIVGRCARAEFVARRRVTPAADTESTG